VFLQADIRLIEGPADSLEVGTNVEEVPCVGVEAGKDAFLADGDAEVSSAGSWIAHL
jgi:hypothetical protein